MCWDERFPLHLPNFMKPCATPSQSSPGVDLAAPLVLDPHMCAVFELSRRLRPAAIPVLILGETGSGKEVVADWIHGAGGARPMVKINCAGLTESVVESELFGHERGAFTGAFQAHKGVFESAHGGTLFLDEIAELPLRTQAKLLRVLEAGEFTRVGSAQATKVKVRFIAATHRDLRDLVARGEFRRDLYFRLNGATLEIPPLRERKSEIVPLAQRFMQGRSDRLERPLELDRSAEVALCEYQWPGNIRELRNVIECAATFCVNSVVTARELTFDRPLCQTRASIPARSVAREAGSSVAGASDFRQLRAESLKFERAHIIDALQVTGGNQTRAALLLGISRRTLTNKLNMHCIGRPRKPKACREEPDTSFRHAPLPTREPAHPER